MFCDIVGSVALAERLDPEDLHDLLATFQRLGTKVVEAAGGLIARYQGDGILAYFGYPLAQEDDAEQAITTGLELVEAVGELGPADERLRVRVGIATGIVIVGELVKSSQMDEPPIVGEPPILRLGCRRSQNRTRSLSMTAHIVSPDACLSMTTSVRGN
jgi:class 3 adenylate cyclase